MRLLRLSQACATQLLSSLPVCPPALSALNICPLITWPSPSFLSLFLLDSSFISSSHDSFRRPHFSTSPDPELRPLLPPSGPPIPRGLPYQFPTYVSTASLLTQRWRRSSGWRPCREPSQRPCLPQRWPSASGLPPPTGSVLTVELPSLTGPPSISVLSSASAVQVGVCATGWPLDHRWPIWQILEPLFLMLLQHYWLFFWE